MSDDIETILRRPYHWVIMPDGDTFFGEVLEFPGCFACEDTPEQTMTSLREVAESWLLSAFAQGQSVPEPIDAMGREIREAFGRSKYDKSTDPMKAQRDK